MARGRHGHRRRTVTPVGAVVALALIGAAVGLYASGSGRSGAQPSPADSTPDSSSPTSSLPASTTTTTTVPLNQVIPPGRPIVDRRLVPFRTIGGDISPKSVVATNTGLVFAQNMMYRHTVTVYSSHGDLLKTISDGVELSKFGVKGRPGVTHGAPVEGALEPNGRYYWVSNYSMYGEGSGPEGSDTCTPESAEAAGDTPSFLYRISTKTLSIDGVAPAGFVPKVVAVTPNDEYVLAANWCSWNLTVDSTTTMKTVATIPIGAYPRGIAVSPDSHFAYVAIMGSDALAVVDLRTLQVVGHIEVGETPRAVVIDPADPAILYVSLNLPGDVVEVNRHSGKILAEVHTGQDCRSLAISTDGTALFVVNYLSNTMTMLRASDLKTLQVVSTGVNPVGITFDATSARVWVAVYTGEILVYNLKAPHPSATG